MAGVLGGILGGMGIGGGSVLIPILVLFLGQEQHTAQGINLLYFIPTALSALYVHIKNRSIDFNVCLCTGSFGIIGAFVGSYLAVNMNGILLKKIFAVFLLIVGIIEIIGSFSKKYGKN